MNRSETLKRLERLMDMSDKDISINPQWIRELAGAAHMHINVLRSSRTNRKALRREAEHERSDQ